MTPTGMREKKKKSSVERIRIEDPSKCYNCKKVGLPTDINYCPSCGFPQGKSEKEQKEFLLDQRHKRKLMDEMQGNLQRGCYILYFVGVFNLCFLLIPDAIVRITSLIVGITFLILGYMARSRPFITLLTSLIVYASYTLLLFLSNPTSVIAMLGIRIGVIAALIFGMNAALKAEKLQKELGRAKVQ